MATPALTPLTEHGERLYDRIGDALSYIADHQADQPDLAAMARAAGMSPHHFQRVFTRWVGLSPKRFLQYLTLDHAKTQLESAASVLDAAYDAGLSGPGRLHDLFVTHEAVTPGEHKAGGAGLEIDWGFHDSPFGECLVMTTTRGLCGLAFVAGEGRDATFDDMARRWPRATFREDAEATAPIARRVFQGDPAEPLHLVLHGTNFQVRVWEALLRIPSGRLVAYGDVARHIGQPTAHRAVGAAIGANPISWLVPCHRAILSNGYLRNYAWGKGRKAAMIGWEAAQAELRQGAAA